MQRVPKPAHYRPCPIPFMLRHFWHARRPTGVEVERGRESSCGSSKVSSAGWVWPFFRVKVFVKAARWSPVIVLGGISGRIQRLWCGSDSGIGPHFRARSVTFGARFDASAFVSHAPSLGKAAGVTRPWHWFRAGSTPNLFRLLARN